MQIIKTSITQPSECEYLPDRLKRLEASYVTEMTGQEYEEHMNKGYRKFGPQLFKPVCEGCSECRPIRILVNEFKPSRSQKKTLNRNADLTIDYCQPGIDDEKLNLINRYHEERGPDMGWPYTTFNKEEYAWTFIANPIEGYEINIRKDNKLLGVTLMDVTPNAVSGVYHYYDTEVSEKRSLGTYLMLKTIEAAERINKKYAYFGFHVQGCRSMEYKSNFEPCEIQKVDGDWQRVT